MKKIILQSWKTNFTGISSFTLHILAMILMLGDHLWATIVPGNQWLTWIGRLAYPIFAFLIVEGYYHTHDFRKYLKRLFVFALLSEIPFNLMYGGSVIYPFHQNVLWTFLIVLISIHAMEKIRKKFPIYFTIPGDALIIFLAFTIATFTMTDYFGYGVLTAFVFYFLRGKKWWQILAQIIALYYINGIMMGGHLTSVTVFGLDFEIAQQSMAVLSLIPITLYRGKQGPHNKIITYVFYAFYPVHMLILSLIWLYL